MENPQAESTAAPPPAASDPGRRTEYTIVIGSNANYYLEKFDALDAGASRAGWHWPAFFVPAWWSLYRKLWLPGILFLIWPGIAFILMALASVVVAVTASLALVVLAWVFAVLLMVAPYVVMSMFANAYYWRHAKRLVDDATARFPNDASQRQARLNRDGGTSVGAMIGIILGIGIVGTGMLAAIAIPAYQDYTIRSQVTEGLNLASELKDEVGSYWTQHQKWPDQSDLGGQPRSGKYTADVSVQTGSIIITYGNQANANIAGKRLVLQAGLVSGQEVVWACANASLPDGATPGEGPHGSEVPNKYLPSRCRAQ